MILDPTKITGFKGAAIEISFDGVIKAELNASAPDVPTYSLQDLDLSGEITTELSYEFMIYLMLATLPKDDPSWRWLSVMMTGRKFR